MRILRKLNRAKLNFSWVVRDLGYAIDRCATCSGPLSRTTRRIPNYQGSSLRQTRDQPPPWQEKVNKASPSIVVLRMVTAYRLEKCWVDNKIINTINIHIDIHIFICFFERGKTLLIFPCLRTIHLSSELPFFVRELFSPRPPKDEIPDCCKYANSSRGIESYFLERMSKSVFISQWKCIRRKGGDLCSIYSKSFTFFDFYIHITVIVVKVFIETHRL